MQVCKDVHVHSICSQDDVFERTPTLQEKRRNGPMKIAKRDHSYRDTAMLAHVPLYVVTLVSLQVALLPLRDPRVRNGFSVVFFFFAELGHQESTWKQLLFRCFPQPAITPRHCTLMPSS